MSVQKNTITIYENGLQNTVLTDRVNYTPAMVKQAQGATTSVQPELDSPRDGTTIAAHDDGTERDDYVAEHSVRNIGEGDTLRNLV